MSQARKLRRQLVKRAAVAAVAQLHEPATKIRAVAQVPASPILVASGATARKLSSTICIDGVIEKKADVVVREQLAALGSKRDIALHLNSEGGSVTKGIAIYHALRRHEGRVVATVDGLAASMASIVLQAADERRVSRGSYVMIHNPSGGVEGEAGEMRQTADLLDQIRSDMLDIYEVRTGQDRDKIAAMMDAETYLNADEAVKLGFADVVDEAEAKIDVRAVARLDEQSKKIPEALRAKMATQAKGNATMTDEEKEEMASLKAEVARLKAAAAKAEDDGEDSDDEEEASAEGDDTPHDEDDGEDDKDKEEAKAVLRAARRLTGKKSLAAVAGSLMAIASTSISARATEVKALIDGGKLAPRDKAWALGASEREFGAYKKGIGGGQVAPVGRAFVQPTKKDGEGSDTELTAEEAAYAKATGKSKDHIIASRKLSALGKAG